MRSLCLSTQYMQCVLVIAGRLAFAKKPQEVSSPSRSYDRKTIDNWKTFAKSQGICSAVVLLMDCVSPFLRSQRTLHVEIEQWWSPDVSVTGLNVSSYRWML